MKWVALALAWMLIAFFMLAFFHAMVTIRDMETIKFDDDDELEKEEF